MSDSPLAVRLRGVAKSFGGRPVLAGVDLDVPQGSLVVLLGTSGAGKSTLLRLVAGLETADEGTIEVEGTLVSDPSPRVPSERRGVAMVFQTLELWPHMTAAENVAFGLPGRPRGKRAATHPRVAEVAREVGLPEDLLGRRPPTLSGGERQRVAIARALAPRPAVVLYDEPLANLDPERRTEIRSLIRHLKANGAASMLYVTHDASEALEMGDSIAVLDGGRVVDLGAPAHLYRSPATVAGARALGAVSVVPASARDGLVTTALGAFPAERPGAVAALGVRPEQVVPAASGGVAAEILDCFPRGPDWEFTARLVPAGNLVRGRSPSPLASGQRVGLAVSGTPLLFSSVPREPDGDAA